MDTPNDLTKFANSWGTKIHRAWLRDFDVEDVIQETALAICQYERLNNPLHQIFYDVRRSVVREILKMSPESKAHVKFALVPSFTFTLDQNMDLQDAIDRLPAHLRDEWLRYHNTNFPVDYRRVSQANASLRLYLREYDSDLIIPKPKHKIRPGGESTYMKILVLSRGYLYTIPKNAVDTIQYQVERWNHDAINHLISLQDEHEITIVDPACSNTSSLLSLSRELAGFGLHNVYYWERNHFPTGTFDAIYLASRLVPSDLAKPQARTVAGGDSGETRAKRPRRAKRLVKADASGQGTDATESA